MPILGPVSLKTHARKGHAFPEDPELVPIFQEMGRHLMLQKERNPGFFPALLSTLRNFPLSDMEVGPSARGRGVCGVVDRDGRRRRKGQAGKKASVRLTSKTPHTRHTHQWAYHAVAEKLWPNSTLVVWGDLDEVTPFGHSETVMRIFGPEKARLAVLPQCGHVDALEVPRSIDDMMGAVLAHLS